MKKDIIEVIHQFVSITPEEEKLILSLFERKEIKKGDFILREGEKCQFVVFLESGLVRYFVLKNDEESTFEFTKEGEFVADYSSFNRNIISHQNIEAIEDCSLLMINYDNLQYIFKRIENGNLLGRLIMEHRFDIMVNQLLDVYRQNSEQRYLKFVEEYKDLSQRIPQYLIASFVGVQPPSLSRIRKRLSI